MDKGSDGIHSEQNRIKIIRLPILPLETLHRRERRNANPIPTSKILQHLPTQLQRSRLKNRSGQHPRQPKPTETTPKREQNELIRQPNINVPQQPAPLGQPAQ